MTQIFGEEDERMIKENNFEKVLLWTLQCVW